MTNIKRLYSDAEGEFFPINEEAKSIVINGNEFILPDLVFSLLLQFEAERDYYKRQLDKISPVKLV